MTPSDRSFFGTLIAATIVLMAATTLDGCGRQPCIDQRPNECWAEDLVWVDTYAASDLARPRVFWECDQRCKDAWGLCGVWKPYDQTCQGGLYYADRNEAHVDNDPMISTTSLAHELLHGFLHFRFGVSDPNHQRPEWLTLVPEANQRLKTAGL